MKKIFIIIALVLGLLIIKNISSASEVTGNLTTGVETGVIGTVIVNPTASPAAGTYTSSQSVSLTASGAIKIRYTTDGTDPNCTTAGINYVLAIPVGESLTIKAISCYPNNNASSVSSFDYVINLPTPTPSPSGGGGGGGGGGGWNAPTPLSGGASQVDANNDGAINILDFNTLMIQWGSTGPNLSGDFDKNGVVDMIDFNMLMVYWS